MTDSWQCMVLAFSGKMGSGKTSITRKLASRLNWPLVSFGDYVRLVAHKRNLNLERTTLQGLGEELLDAGVLNFCQSVLGQIDWRGNCFIIDGVRHEIVLRTLRELVVPLPLIHIHLFIDEVVRQDRLKQRNQIDAVHSTEFESHQLLADIADFTVETKNNIDETILNIIGILENAYGGYNGR